MNDRKTAPSHDEIARAAFARYERRGRVPGHEETDWHEAERELREAAGGAETSAAEDAETPEPQPESQQRQDRAPHRAAASRAGAARRQPRKAAGQAGEPKPRRSPTKRVRRPAPSDESDSAQ